MVIRYLDPEFGNDANDGLSFVNRKKTLASVSAGLTGGDEIRVIESVESLFSTQLSWVDNTTTIGIPTGTVKLVNNFDTAWTHSANVSGTTNNNRKIGSTSSAINIAAGFTTGKASYLTLPAPLDLSSWQCVSFWFQMSNTNANQNMDICLCSDTIGDVPVVTIPVMESNWNYNTWKRIFYDHGSALPSGINSVSLFVNSDQGACNCLINNMVASLPRSSTDHISHLSLIGQKTDENPEYYAIQSITESTITLYDRSDRNAAETGIVSYKGPTGGFDTYIMKAIPTRWNNTMGTQANGGVNLLNMLKITGGWSASDMSTQSGVTWLHFMTNFDYPIWTSFTYLEKIGLADIADSQNHVISGGGEMHFEGFVGWSGGGNPYSANTSSRTVFSSKFFNGGNDPLNFFNGAAGGFQNIDVGLITRHTNQVGLALENLTIGNLISTKLNRYWNNSVPLSPSFSNDVGIYKNISFKNNTTDISINNNHGTNIVIQNCFFASSPNISLHSSPKGTVYLSGINNNSQDIRIYNANYTIITDNAITHSYGLSWKVSPTLDSGLFRDDYPILHKLGDVAVRSGILVVVSCYVRRSHATEINGGILVENGWLSGVGDVKEYITIGADDWEELVLSFTPSANGIIPIWGFCYPDGGITHSFWWDDLTIETV